MKHVTGVFIQMTIERSILVNESTIKRILDKYNVSESDNLSKALSEILSELPKQSGFVKDVTKKQNEEIRINNLIHGIR